MALHRIRRPSPLFLKKIDLSRFRSAPTLASPDLAVLLEELKSGLPMEEPTDVEWVPSACPVDQSWTAPDAIHDTSVYDERSPIELDMSDVELLD